MWGFVADRLGIEERTIDEGSYWVAPAKSVKVLRDMMPWFNNLSKMADDQPRTPYDIFSGTTGIKAIPFETERFTQSKAYEDRIELQDVLQRLRDAGQLEEQPKTSSLADLFGR